MTQQSATKSNKCCEIALLTVIHVRSMIFHTEK